MKTLICILMTLLVSPSVFSQLEAPAVPNVENLHDYYRTGVGVRIGWPLAALTVKHFVKERKALEFIAGPRFGGGSISILAEKHVPARRPAIYWYYGAGLYAGIFDSSVYKNLKGEMYPGDNVVSLGAVLILGIEMNINESPYSISFDIKLRIGIHNPGGSIADGAVAFKYTWGW